MLLRSHLFLVFIAPTLAGFCDINNFGLDVILPIIYFNVWHSLRVSKLTVFETVLVITIRLQENEDATNLLFNFVIEHFHTQKGICGDSYEIHFVQVINCSHFLFIGYH